MHADHNNMDPEPFEVFNAQATSPVLLICEHASCHMPAEYDHLGLPTEHRGSHVAWDPGALGLARQMAEDMGAVLIAGTLSRLIYDLNRPPNAAGSMPARSEVIDVPGNVDLPERERKRRIAHIYKPFHRRVAEALARREAPVIVTVHSFTPVYHGKTREVEIGLLHDADSRLTDAMLEIAEDHSTHRVERNAPYGPKDGVMHTLNIHGDANGYPGVMIEVRNDLIRTTEQQAEIGRTLAGWVGDALARMDANMAGVL